MSHFTKLTLKVLGLNLLSGLIFALPLLTMRNQDDVILWFFLMLAVGVLSLLVQFIVGLVFVSKEHKKELGKAMLLSIGIILLIGLSVCGGGILFNV